MFVPVKVSHGCVSSDVFVSRWICVGRSIYYGREKNKRGKNLECEAWEEEEIWKNSHSVEIQDGVQRVGSLSCDDLTLRSLNQWTWKPLGGAP